MLRVLLLVSTAAGTAALAGCGASSPSSQVGTVRDSRRPAPGRFLSVDSARHAATLTLIAADGSGNNGFNFDGYGRGELLVRVPRGWRLTVHCRNAGPLRNSCAVVSGPQASAPAFRGASTPNPVQGLSSGQSATFSFTPTRVGTYRLASIVPGHEEARQFAVLDVTTRGRPSIHARAGP